MEPNRELLRMAGKGIDVNLSVRVDDDDEESDVFSKASDSPELAEEFDVDGNTSDSPELAEEPGLDSNMADSLAPDIAQGCHSPMKGEDNKS